MKQLLVATAALAASLVAAVPGSSQAAAPGQAQVSLSFNHDCFAMPPLLVVDGDCDGGGYVFSTGPSAPAAGPLTLRGITFQFPSTATGANNTVVPTGQTVTLPGKPGFRFLHLLMFATNGTGAPSRATLSYAAGAKSVVSIAAPDWSVAANAVLTLPRHGLFEPTNMVLPSSNHVFIVSVPLDPRRVVSSITLPVDQVPVETSFGSNPPNLQILAMTLSTTPAGKSGPKFN